MKQNSDHKPFGAAALDEHLRRTKPVFPAPAGFTDKVIAELPARIDPRSASKETPSTGIGLRIGLTVAVITLAALLVVRSRNAPERPEALILTRNKPAPVQVDIPNMTPEEFHSLVANLDRPLEKEWHAMVSDTRQAIQFVASNFIPEK